MAAAGAQAPLVGVTGYSVEADWKVWSEVSSLVPNTYLRCLVGAGAAPLLLTPLLGTEQGALDRLLDVLDAVVLIGGEDVCGVRSGRDESAEAHLPHSDERDAFEIALARRAWERDVPVLGICRGMQVLNVSRGGTLVEDLLSEASSNEHLIERGTFNRHAVSFEAGSRVEELFGPSTVVPSHHHQAVDRLGEDLLVTGRAADDVVESIESPDRRFYLGVQWHPEEGEDMTVFEGLVEAAGARS